MKEYIYRELLDVDGNVVGREYGGELIRCKDCKYYEVAELNYDGTPDKRCKPSVCTNGKYAVERPEDWYCGDAQARRNND